MQPDTLSRPRICFHTSSTVLKITGWKRVDGLNDQRDVFATTSSGDQTEDARDEPRRRRPEESCSSPDDQRLQRPTTALSGASVSSDVRDPRMHGLQLEETDERSVSCHRSVALPSSLAYVYGE